MLTDVKPRRIVRPDSASILQWLRMMYREFGETKGMLRDRDIGRDALELAFGVAMSVNGRTRVSQVGVKYIAKMAGYAGNGHDMYGQLRHLLARGFLTKDGEGGKGGKIPRLMLSMPVELVEPYGQITNNGFGDLLESLEEEVILVTDLKEPAKVPQPGQQRQKPEGFHDPFEETEQP
ncbi:hypothetical protein [Nonomuraea sp. NPDC049758]|uniref:hypothetical protein n=1 Tax=Nonomuraea sp. NPDC049758 TaxID=3154360 RepID=UPI00344ADCDC